MQRMKLDERDSERKQRELRFEHSAKQAAKPKCAKCGTRLLHKHVDAELCLDCQHHIDSAMECLDNDDLEPWTDNDDRRYAEFVEQQSRHNGGINGGILQPSTVTGS